MKTNHISLNILSDYIDQKLPIDDYNKVKKHLAACNECKLEHDKLKKTVQLVSNLNSVKLNISKEFVNETFKKYNKRKRVYNLHKILWPASAAAIFMFFLLSGMLDVNVFQNTNEINYAKHNYNVDSKINNVHREYTIKNQNVENILKLAKENNVTILKVSGNNVIAEAKFSDYQRMRYGASISDEYSGFKANQGLLTVGTKSGSRFETKSKRLNKKERVVRFKINLSN